MPQDPNAALEIAVLVAPHFNVSATTSFVDPFRVANYLSGSARFSWSYLSQAGGAVESSSGLVVQTGALRDYPAKETPWLALVSTSWSPERHGSSLLSARLVRWAQGGAIIGGLDTGGIVLARAGLLKGKSATVHYEHIDAFIELAPETSVTETLFVVEDGVFTCCGGTAATDIALRLLRSAAGESIANAAARYLFHHDVRDEDHSQNPKGFEPMGYVTPSPVRAAIDMMEAHLEAPLTIPDISARLGLSQRHLGRLFRRYVRKSPVAYYRDIRLDRARGLVTQTELRLSEIAAAAGFNSQAHFTRAYHQRFGLAPSADRVQGRVPFEFRAWPMHQPGLKSAGSA
ncbi:Transcriptional regulator, AraC family [Candidatus Rhodobacter oscarellae]|uniref:Transcriptional regulator, AraC family n=1 Tax=Candidatus Rhodobacter oscarellae TaxID=1675527 RepID=A0A0J9GRU0_9RHOB|nr:GlxA family transcriptional regulator [Candidatus Rhodobacter lobularis]KMW56193.1 Transcriptional regulator, AraC family [Candidatus Rhodobacter lobularis]